MLDDGLVVHFDLGELGCNGQADAGCQVGVVDADIAEQGHRLRGLEVEVGVLGPGGQEGGVGHVVEGVELQADAIVQARDQEELVYLEGELRLRYPPTAVIEPLGLIDDDHHSPSSCATGNFGATLAGYIVRVVGRAQSDRKPLRDRVRPLQRRIHDGQRRGDTAHIFIHIVIDTQPRRPTIIHNRLCSLVALQIAINIIRTDGIESKCHIAGIIECHIQVRSIHVPEHDIRHSVLLVIRCALVVQVDHRCISCNELDEIVQQIAQDDTDEQQ